MTIGITNSFFLFPRLHYFKGVAFSAPNTKHLLSYLCSQNV